MILSGSHSAIDRTHKGQLCDKLNPKLGLVRKCELGQSAPVLGIVICVIFALTAAFAIYGVSFYRTSGHMPEYATKAAEPVSSDDVENDDHAS